MSGAMILLPSEHKVLEETVVSHILAEKRDPIDCRLCDFDDVSYRVFVDPADTTTMLISMTMPCYTVIKDFGGEAALKENFGDYITAGDEHVNLKLDMDSLKDNAAEFCKKLSLLRSIVIGGSFKQFFSALKNGTPSPQPFKFNLRKDTEVFLLPKSDRVSCTFCLNFTEKTDLTIAQVFMAEFVEARRRREVAKAPIVGFSFEPPLEVSKGFGITEAQGNVGYVTFSILEEHVTTDAKMDNAINLLVGFRNYLQYHIKCSKSYFHSRMRARVASLLQILNRAKPDDIDKKKTTASGKSFAKR